MWARQLCWHQPGASGSSQTVIAKEVLQSRALLTDFIRRHELAVPLKTTTAWDTNSEHWQHNYEVCNSDSGEWKVGDNDESFAPTDWDLVKNFGNNHLSVSENKVIGILTVSIKSLSPVAAKEWCTQLIADINEYMRREDVGISEARIAFLESKLSEATIAGMQQVFYQLIESETRTLCWPTLNQNTCSKL